MRFYRGGSIKFLSIIHVSESLYKSSPTTTTVVSFLRIFTCWVGWLGDGFSFIHSYSSTVPYVFVFFCFVVFLLLAICLFVSLPVLVNVPCSITWWMGGGNAMGIGLDGGIVFVVVIIIIITLVL